MTVISGIAVGNEPEDFIIETMTASQKHIK